ncbi:glycosyltransferase family 2 protein [Flexibacterium corallicola]|uniref:glycosyltransferase family 2 protein n=1 Tax=Flexibacterium corallicola TaxID=3037259 RepID=UPI00286F0293|nr:glycosyltransferase family 2 protein [Pseudovibrio sp. M1P-2-3]
MLELLKRIISKKQPNEEEKRHFLKGKYSDLGSFDVEVLGRTEATFVQSTTLFEGEVVSKTPEAGKTNVLACVTMYNEPSDLFEQTLSGLAASIKHLQLSNDAIKSENIIIVFIVDGATKLHHSTRQMMVDRGLLPDNEVDYSAQNALTLYESVLTLEASCASLRIITSIKHTNGGKLDSHRWILRSIAPGIDPVCWLQIDVGNVPNPESLLEISKIFDKDPTIAAVVPRVELEPVGSIFDPLYAYQHADFIMSRLVRLPSLDILGYIDMIPGQMSATRWELFNQKTETGQTVADRYLEGLQATAPYDIIRFLTEDALIGFELMCSEKNSLRVVSSYKAMSQVEPCNTLETLLKQRKRWINGGSMSTWYQAVNLMRYWRASKAKLHRKLRFTFIALWTVLTSFLALIIGPAAIVGILALDISAAESLPAGATDPMLIIIGIAALCLVLPASLATTPYIARVKPLQVRTMLTFAAIGNIVLIGVSTFKLGLWAVLFATLPMVFLFIILGLILGRRTLRVVLRSVWSFVFLLLPVNLMLQIYAIFNLNNASWGTKGVNKPQSTMDDVKPEIVERQLRRFRDVALIGYCLLSSLLAVMIVAEPSYVIPIFVLVGTVQLLAYLAAITKALQVTPHYSAQRSQGNKFPLPAPYQEDNWERSNVSDPQSFTGFDQPLKK